MRLMDLAGFYAIVGVACAVGLRRGRHVGARDVALLVVLWPVYLPALLASGPGTAGERAGDDGPVARERRLLAEALEAVTDPTLTRLLPTREQWARLGEHLAALDARVRDLDEVIARPEFAGESVRASADRLRALRGSTARERDELLALCEKLRVQVTVVRFAGARVTDEGELGPLVAEVIGRLEGLGAALDPGLESRP